MTNELKSILEAHSLWLEGCGGEPANLQNADLQDADLRDADLRDVDLRDANLRRASLDGTNLDGANLRCANLRGANLRDVSLQDANLRGANLRGANLRDANLLCFGNMREIHTMQIDTWPIGYTADTLQIGCQRHPIEKWRRWNTPAGRKWIEGMDHQALNWACRNLSLVLAMIDANPATPTGREDTPNDQ